MCRLLMSWYVLQYQAICNHIIDSFSVTQDAEFIIIDLTTVWKGKEYRAIDWTLWFHYYHKPVHWSI